MIPPLWTDILLVYRKNECAMEKILIIGNGFDIAHGLPTRYGDFIEFLAAFESLYDTYALKNQKLTDEEFNSIKTEKLNFKLTQMLHAYLSVEDMYTIQMVC